MEVRMVASHQAAVGGADFLKAGAEFDPQKYIILAQLLRRQGWCGVGGTSPCGTAGNHSAPPRLPDSRYLLCVVQTTHRRGPQNGCRSAQDDGIVQIEGP